MSYWNRQSSEERIEECLDIIEERTKSLLEAEAKGDTDRVTTYKRQIEEWLDVIKCVYRNKHKGSYRAK